MKSHTPIPALWASSHGHLHRERLRREASEQARSHALPLSLSELETRFRRLRKALQEKLALDREPTPLDVRMHGEVARDGYRIQKVSFLSEPGVRVTGNLYVPDGTGPFPAVLNMHGHWPQGKIAAKVQARGHLLARQGMVTLAVDAAGTGERAEKERDWTYHGALKAAEMFLAGDSLMGRQVRDNRRALDVLQSLPFVDGEKIGATGASGGGNQTMWLAALDARVKAAVVVVSVGSFEAYVTERNCLCETLPGGLLLAEEWEVLGLIAPRPLLILNALHDICPAFGHAPMDATCRQVEEVYLLHNAREKLDWRVFETTHGYHPPMLQALLGWMGHWLAGEPGSSPHALPDWLEVSEEELLCFPPGERPAECGYPAVRAAGRLPDRTFASPDEARAELARLVGWTPPAGGAEWVSKRALPEGTRVGAILSPQMLPLPVAVNGPWPAPGAEFRLVLSPFGKAGAFGRAQWREAAATGLALAAADLPGVGELAWETEPVADVRLHDTARARLWLGSSLAAEWAGAIAVLCEALQARAPGARMRVVAEKEAVLAALLCQALHPAAAFELVESDCPASAADPQNDSLVWCLPGFLPWGDLPALRRLATPRGDAR